ncbi:MAG: hypothetical protein KDE58_32150, partial [Caldilineaceae bacterium]|nr:hypothetical protein [Caldilineaceae bacterium]
TSDDQVSTNYQNPIDAKAHIYAPFIKIDEETGAVVDRIWRGAKENVSGSATGISSSRLGPDSVDLPDGESLLGADGVLRFSLTQASAVSIGVGGILGGSLAFGTSHGLIDFFDMNGDQFPDVLVGIPGTIQYSNPRGGLESGATNHNEFNAQVRMDSTTTQSINGGGTAASINADAKGDANTPQDVDTSSGQSSSGSSDNDGEKSIVTSGSKDSGETNGDTGDAPPADKDLAGMTAGLSGDLGWSSTNTRLEYIAAPTNLLESEFADMNGDGLPDRVSVYKDGSLRVAFNLGYDFSSEVEWPGGIMEQGKSNSVSVGPDLGFSVPPLSFSGGLSLSSSEENALSTWVDINGDGLTDQIRLDVPALGDLAPLDIPGPIDWVPLDGDVEVRFNTGAGLTDSVDWGDFHADAIAKAESIGLSGGGDFTVGIGPLCIKACYIIINPGAHVSTGMSRQELELNDINGDGYPDHIASDSDSSMDVKLNTTGRTNLLKSVANPLGGTIELDYSREGNTTDLPFSQWVLSRVAVDDGRPGDGVDVSLSTYEYDGNVYHPLEREGLGYATVIEHQRDSSVAGEPILRSFEQTYANNNVFDSGLLLREAMLAADGSLIKDTVNSYAFQDVETGGQADLNTDPSGVGLLPMIAYPKLVKTENRGFLAGVAKKQTWTTFTYDNLGNVVRIEDMGEPALPEDDVIAEITYSDCTDSTWIALASSFVVKDGDGNVLRSRRADDQLCDNGGVTKLWEDTGNGEALIELDFDAWGNYNTITYPPNANGERYQVTYVFDSDRHTDIARVEDSFGLVGTATYHGPTGQFASQTDANGQTTSYTYDPQGRLASISGPYEQGTGNATVSFEYFPTAPDYAYGLAHHFDLFHPGDPISTVRFVDGTGRETQSKQNATVFQGVDQAAADVMIVSGALEFDGLGRIVKEWYPITEPLGTIGVYNDSSSTVSPTLLEYTTTGLVSKVTAPDGSVTATDYNYDDGSLFGTTMYITTRTDPLGNVRRTYGDVRGNLLATAVDHDPATDVTLSAASHVAGEQQTSDQAEQPPAETYTEHIYLPLIAGGSEEIELAQITPKSAVSAASVSETYLTWYRYNPLQQLVAVVDLQGNTTTHEYDRLGRRTATTTPDGGRVETTYDLASQVISKVTPNLRAMGGQIEYSYAYNRLTGISYPDGTPNVRYTYGAPGAPNNGAGRIVQVEDGARVQLRQFGRLGEVVEETTTMLVHNLIEETEQRLTWTTQWDFDTWGRPKSMTYPDGEVLTYVYDTGGLLASVAGQKDGVAYPYVDRMEYDHFLARRFLLTGNGVATESRYDAETRRLAHQIADAPGRRIQDLAYTYDLVGNVLAVDHAAPTPRSDLKGGTSQHAFVYDDLYRLVSATGTYQYAPNKRREYTYGLTYDSLGNILQKAQSDTIFNTPNNGVVQQKTSYNQAYSYNAAPHQPTQIGGHA